MLDAIVSADILILFTDEHSGFVAGYDIGDSTSAERLSRFIDCYS